LKREHSGTLKAITWPWQWEEMSKTLETINKHKQTFTFALQGDVATTSLAIHDKVNDIQREIRTTIVEAVKDIHGQVQDSKHKEILAWLSKVDTIKNHTAARSKSQAGTGEWFLLSPEYSSWLQRPRSLVWLHGIPGAGKTILCSTIIQDVKSRSSTDTACLYFYFDCGNVQKQSTTSMIYSLLAQLSYFAITPEVRQLYEQCNNGARQPLRN
jgi:hypothetical protein